MNIKAKTIKLLEERGGNLHDLAFGNDFLNMTPKAQATNARIEVLDYVKF